MAGSNGTGTSAVRADDQARDRAGQVAEAARSLEQAEARRAAFAAEHRQQIPSTHTVAERLARCWR